ncbi:hypothetical protein FMM58_00720 [Campylobacter sp. LR291e]|uniref:hypothetical protein n=1 Tax=Campylobacter sp. LR291e TaxID=2593546 RepID=UPI00123C702E|nr:hypothetical protein [Campylobacter sp. LR291e]KAA6234045.1 hypothetical protein FMM58_00720 [Campylobacter sp. LR291e]
MRKSIKMAKQEWNFEKTCNLYEKYYQKDENLILEYINFLANTGKIIELKELVLRLSKEHIQALIDKKYIGFEEAKNILNFLTTLEKIENDKLQNNIESNIYYLTLTKQFSPLNELLKLDLCYGGGLKTLVLNFAINELIKAKCLDEMIFKKIIIMYANTKLETLTKQYFLTKLLLYFYNQKNLAFLDHNFSRLLNLLFVEIAQNNTNDIELPFIKIIYENLRQNYPSLNELYLQKQKLYANLEQKPLNSPLKIAVLISGQIRGNYEEIFKEFNKTFIDNLNADAFVCTWDKHYEYPGLCHARHSHMSWVGRICTGFVYPKDIEKTSFLINNMPNTYKKLDTTSMPLKTNKNIFKTIQNIKDILILNEEEIFEKEIKGYKNSNVKTQLNIYKMLYCWKEGLNQILNYEKENNITYNFIIRLRPDIVVTKIPKTQSLLRLKENELYTSCFNGMVGDNFFFGQRKTMVKTLSLYDDIKKTKSLAYIKEIPNIDSIHFILYRHIAICDIFLKYSTLPTNWTICLKNIKKPDISKEVLQDFLNANENLKNRKDIWDFFELAFNAKVPFDKFYNPKFYNPNLHTTKGAVLRVKNQLSYKLGKAIIDNSHSLMGFIRMPYVLSYIADIHKKSKLKHLTPIEKYEDYEESLKCKEHLSYKLGQALIKANKNKFKGGYIKFLFEVRNILKKHKERL